jgi:hypothetical protein
MAKVDSAWSGIVGTQCVMCAIFSTGATKMSCGFAGEVNLINKSAFNPNHFKL